MSQTVNLDIILKDISDKWLDQVIQKTDADNGELIDIISAIDLSIVTPPPENWFEWARMTSLDSIRVIIIGQDPYPTKGDAHGLSFSALNSFPRSLQNIFKCLEHHGFIKNYRETKTDLSSWAKQGVLLFNTALTTEIKNPGAHVNLWEDYSTRILRRVLRHHIGSNLFILCWGKVAQDLIKGLTKKHSDKYNVLNWCHPSPLNQDKFIPCDHFVRVNEYYSANGLPPIDWHSIESTPTQIIFTDGSCQPVKKEHGKYYGGYSVVFTEGTMHSKVLIGAIDQATNIRAECQAIIEALKVMDKIKEPQHIIIYTDSEFWIKMIYKYMPAWVANGVAFDSKANPDLTQELFALWNACRHKIKLEHVYSHNKTKLRESKNLLDQKKYKGNELADKYAAEGRQLKPAEQKWIDLIMQPN